MKHPERRSRPQQEAKARPLDPAIAARAHQFRQAPSPEEIARRQAAWADILKAQAEMSPMDEDVTELLRRARDEEDARLNG